MARFDVTHFEWSVIQPRLPTDVSGKDRLDDRCVLNGIFWRLRTGAQARVIRKQLRIEVRAVASSLTLERRPAGQKAERTKHGKPKLTRHGMFIPAALAFPKGELPCPIPSMSGCQTIKSKKRLLAWRISGLQSGGLDSTPTLRSRGLPTKLSHRWRAGWQIC